MQQQATENTGISWHWLVLAVLLLGIVIAVWFWPEPPVEQVEPVLVIPEPVELPAAEPEPEPAQLPEPPVAVATEPEVAPLPPLLPVPDSLSGSDSYWRQLADKIAPQMSQWLVPDEQVRKWVLLVDLMADGNLSKKYRPLDYPMPAFKANKTDVAIFVDEANYSRADQLVDTLTAIEPDTLIRYYRAWQPLLEDAYREQGKAGSFDQRLQLALQRIADSSERPGKGALTQPHVLYKYSDKNLEQRSDVDKLLWRLGEENRLKLQQYSRQILPLLQQ